MLSYFQFVAYRFDFHVTQRFAVAQDQQFIVPEQFPVRL